MPTTSQNKVMTHINGKPGRKKGKVLKQVKMEPSYQFDKLNNNVDEDKLSEVASFDHVTTAVQDDQSVDGDGTEFGKARTSARLHNLGFWSKKDKKKKKIGVTEPEVPMVESTQYVEEISKQVEEKVAEKIKRPVSKRRDPPEQKPTAVCFELKSSIATHTDVLSKMKDLLYYRRGSKIVSVQFIPKSRWIIVLDSTETRDRLAGVELFIGPHCVLLRRYDDVMKMEYKKYLRSKGLLEMVNSAIK